MAGAAKRRGRTSSLLASVLASVCRTKIWPPRRLCLTQTLPGLSNRATTVLSFVSELEIHVSKVDLSLPPLSSLELVILPLRSIGRGAEKG